MSLPWKVIPLLGEMSATQTKGCPFPEEKGDHEVVDESMKRKLHPRTFNKSYKLTNLQSFI